MHYLLPLTLLLMTAPLAHAQDASEARGSDALLGSAATTSRVMFDDLVWAEVIPGVAFATAYGDWQAERHGKFVRFDPGTSVALHTHTSAFHGVIVSGRLTNQYEGEGSPQAMGSGAHWYVPGGVPHINTCVSEEACLFYTHFDDALDVTFVEQ
jgi:hypothetical protein